VVLDGLHQVLAPFLVLDQGGLKVDQRARLDYDSMATCAPVSRPVMYPVFVVGVA
jgi:hypothetical protein